MRTLIKKIRCKKRVCLEHDGKLFPIMFSGTQHELEKKMKELDNCLWSYSDQIRKEVEGNLN